MEPRRGIAALQVAPLHHPMMRIAIKPDVVGIGHATIDPQNRAECARMDKRGGDAHLDALADLEALGGHASWA